MRLVIGIAGARADLDLRSLHDWLVGEDIRPRPRLTPGAMGAEDGVLTVEVPDARSLGALAEAVAAWRVGAGRAGTGPVITLRWGDGRSLVLDVPAEELPRAMVAALRAEAERGDDDSAIVPIDSHHSVQELSDDDETSLRNTSPGPPFGDDDDEW